MANRLTTRCIFLIFPVLFFALSALAQEGLRAGVEAPDFKLPTISGKTVTLREFQNKGIVIVHLWKSK